MTATAAIHHPELELVPVGAADMDVSPLGLAGDVTSVVAGGVVGATAPAIARAGAGMSGSGTSVVGMSIQRSMRPSLYVTSVLNVSVATSVGSRAIRI
jgi:hypothetical protein